jgi:hypothetical protein
VTQGPRLSIGPPKRRAPSEREGTILALARRWVLEFPGSTDNGEQLGHWYRLTGNPELVRREFLKATGRSNLLDKLTGKEVELHLGRTNEGLIGVTVWFRNADRYRSFVKLLMGPGGMDSWFTRWVLPPFADSLPGRTTPRARLRRREARTVARVLAIHYLSRSGGGTRTIEAAAELYRTEIERAAEGNRRAGRRLPKGWQALPESWRMERTRVLAELRQDFGPL